MQYLDVWMFSIQHWSRPPLFCSYRDTLQQPELFSAVLKTKTSLSRTLYTNQASAGRMTFLSTLHAKLSSQLIRILERKEEFVEFASCGGLDLYTVVLICKTNHFIKPLGNWALSGSSAPAPLSFMGVVLLPIEWKDRTRAVSFVWSTLGADPGASEPQMHFSCHREWHCCGGIQVALRPQIPSSHLDVFFLRVSLSWLVLCLNCCR